MATKRIESLAVGVDSGADAVSAGVSHSVRTPDLDNRFFFSAIRVAGEGTRASFSTVLATRVLEIFGSLLALLRNCLLFFVGLRALA